MSTEDENFWLETVKGIKKTESGNIVTHKKAKKTEVRNRPQFAVIQEFSTYSKALGDDTSGIDDATLKKFKHEEFRTEAMLDLHGMTEDEAFERVDNFIPACYNAGKRCIIIITGKGQTIRPDDDIFTPKGILKRQVPQWLDMPRLRAMILVYKHPSERLGGEGALYILLKRKKN